MAEAATWRYHTFYQAMKQWGRYQITDSPDKAELIFEVSYGVVDHGTSVWSATNTATGQTQVYSARDTDPQIRLSVYDGKSHEALWLTLQHRELARFERNREKNTIKATETLVQDFRRRVELPQRGRSEEDATTDGNVWIHE